MSETNQNAMLPAAAGSLPPCETWVLREREERYGVTMDVVVSETGTVVVRDVCSPERVYLDFGAERRERARLIVAAPDAYRNGVMAERERCAKIADEISKEIRSGQLMLDPTPASPQPCARECQLIHERVVNPYSLDWDGLPMPLHTLRCDQQRAMESIIAARTAKERDRCAGIAEEFDHQPNPFAGGDIADKIRGGE